MSWFAPRTNVMFANHDYAAARVDLSTESRARLTPNSQLKPAERAEDQSSGAKNRFGGSGGFQPPRDFWQPRSG